MFFPAVPKFQHVQDGQELDIIQLSVEYQRVGRPISYSASWVNWLVRSAHLPNGMHVCTDIAFTCEKINTFDP